MMSVQDILPFSTSKPTPGRRLNMDFILPFILVPVLLVIATISETITIVVMVVIGMGALYVQSRPRQKNRSLFFYSWTLSSGVCGFLVFEIGVLQLLEITQLENFSFLLLLACTCYFFYKMKAVADSELATGSSKGKEYSPVLTSESHYCQICQIEVNEKFFHSIWLNCCIIRANYIYFLGGQVFAFATLVFGTNLGLTTVCLPTVLFYKILLPETCDDVYFEFHLALCFVTCIYGCGYVLVIAFILIHHIFVYIPKYIRCELLCRKRSNMLNA